VCESENFHVELANHTDINIENVDSVSNLLNDIRPDVIFNTAAYHNVPICEENPELSFAVNALGALNVARVAENLNSINVYFSTDYVFDGKKQAPYEESDLPNPLNVYASSKLLGEYYSLNYCSKSYVLRISGIYGSTVCRAKGNNFITTMIKLSSEKDRIKVVTDEILTPTPTMLISEKTVEIIKNYRSGLYHLTCEGHCSWYEFAKKIFETLNINIRVEKTTSNEFPSSVNRPSYSVLDNTNYNNVSSYKLPKWDVALLDFLKKNYLN